jgi:pyruvate dehydrogenase E2 component (dihydrolipoamide acetyltransferase)
MTDVVMPQMGESIVEGTLTKWLKKPGERVERDEPLFEISTDKVDTEIPSPAAGELAEIMVEEGKTVGVNTVVGRINESGGASAGAAVPEADEAAKEDETDKGVGPSAQGASGGGAANLEEQAPAPDKSAEQPTTPTPTPPPASSAANYNAPQPAGAPAPAQPDQPQSGDEPAGPLSPLVRKMAREYNIDLKQVRGTGAGGRITKQDMENYMGQQAARTVASVTAPSQQAPAGAPQQQQVPGHAASASSTDRYAAASAW